MKQFEKLYSIDKKEKIRSFEIEVEDRLIITRTGLLEGKKVEKVITIRTGKQNRTAQQQAEFEATSKWNEKLLEGYKSKKTLELKAKSLNLL